MSEQPALQFDPLAAAAFVERRRRDAEALGLSVRVRRDFAALQQPGAAGGQPAGRLFGAAGFDLLPGRAFWVETADAQGRRVHQQAMRCEDLAGATAAELLDSQLRRLFPESAAGVTGPLDCAPVLQRMRGRLVWHGEAWLAEDWRGRNLAGPLGELALGLALIEWRPDFVLGVASERDTRRGYPLREGYHHAQPLGEIWRLAPSWLYSDDWINWVEGAELARLVNLDRPRSESPHPPPARG